MEEETQLQRHRKKAIELVKKRLLNKEPIFLDYLIDDYLRQEFKLPDRPNGSLPYAGWMVGGKQEATKGMKTSKSGIELIKRHEGLRLNAYMCPGNVLTIGYGHTKSVYPNQVITAETAEELLKKDLLRFEKAVSRYVEVPLTQNQFDALVSFAFNVGVSAFRNSTLLKLLNQGSYKSASIQFGRWVMAGTTKLPGLVRRREEEKRLFLES